VPPPRHPTANSEIRNGPINQSAPNHWDRQYATGLSADHFTGVGAWEYDLRRHRLAWTDGVYDIFGLPQGISLERAAIVEMYHDDSRAQMEALRAHLLQNGGAFTLDAQIWTAEGTPRWMRLNAGVVMEAGQPIRLFGTKQDISHEREALARLRERAEYDVVTGLPNRGAFEARWYALAQGGAPDVTALGLVDLDHFKQINDQWGHEAGDECLRVTAERLRRSLSALAFLARYGGDEFVLLWRGRIDRTFLEWRFSRAEMAMSQPVLWEKELIPVTVSIGIALRQPELAPRDLFRRADRALYRAKAAGRSTTVIEGPPTSV
jgi:diguanylate cyclase (GGDEF)-like protein